MIFTIMNNTTNGTQLDYYTYNNNNSPRTYFIIFFFIEIPDLIQVIYEISNRTISLVGTKMLSLSLYYYTQTPNPILKYQERRRLMTPVSKLYNKQFFLLQSSLNQHH